MSLFSNHDPVTQGNPQILLWGFSCRNYFLLTELRPTASLYRSTLMDERLLLVTARDSEGILA